MNSLLKFNLDIAKIPKSFELILPVLHAHHAEPKKCKPNIKISILLQWNKILA